MIRLSGSVKLYRSLGPGVLARPLAAHRRVLAGGGQNFGAVDGHGDAAHFEHVAAGRHFQHRREAVAHQLAVASTEAAKGVVVGMGVGAEQPRCHVFIGRAFDLPTRKHACRVAIKQQPKECCGRILMAAGSALVDPHAPQVQRAHRVHDEMNQVIARYPLAQVRWQ